MFPRPTSLLAALLLALLPLALAAAPPPVMLASVYEGDVEVGDYWVSEKLDGVRGRWDGSHLITRGGFTIAAPAWFTAGWPDEPLDGELWIGRGRFDEVSGIVRSMESDDKAWRQVSFMVFDLPKDPGPFAARLQRIRRLLAKADVPWLQPIPQFRVEAAAELDAKLAAVVAAGGEGLMLHHRDARYHIGRSGDLVKYKPHDDAEARVIGYTPGAGKYNGLLGALIVERPDGVRFRIGTGFSDAERADPPPLGSWVTYRYNGLTSGGLPRFARFLRIRHELPPPDPR